MATCKDIKEGVEEANTIYEEVDDVHKLVKGQRVRVKKFLKGWNALGGKHGRVIAHDPNKLQHVQLEHPKTGYKGWYHRTEITKPKR